MFTVWGRKGDRFVDPLVLLRKDRQRSLSQATKQTYAHGVAACCYAPCTCRGLIGMRSSRWPPCRGNCVSSLHDVALIALHPGFFPPVITCLEHGCAWLLDCIVPSSIHRVASGHLLPGFAAKGKQACGPANDVASVNVYVCLRKHKQAFGNFLE